MKGNGSLTPKQGLLIKYLLEGETIVDSAKLCKIGETTAHRWLNDTTFQRHYNEQRQKLLNHSLTGLQLKFDTAVKTLSRHMEEGAKTHPRDQVEAAKTVINTTLQTAQLLERIAELEAALAEQEQDLMYKVIFDLRLLTRTERQQLEAIDHACAEREQSTTTEETQ